MSSIVTEGKSSAKGRRVRGSSEEGPVEPWQEPSTFEQTTKNRSVSSASPGPMNSSHHPGSGASGLLRACDPGVSPVWRRIALSRASLRAPQVS